jgi:alpha-L-rhamnosidase
MIHLSFCRFPRLLPRHAASTLTAVAALLASAIAAAAQLTPQNLRCESMDNPSGIDTRQPRLSWTLAAADPAARNQRQTAVQILVASSRAKLDANIGDIWDSSRLPTAEQATLLGEASNANAAALASANASAASNVPAPAALTSGATYHWKARAWDQDNRPSPWSAPATWVAGLLDPAEWRAAHWIGQPERINVNDKASGPTKTTRWFRKNLDLTTPPPAATVHIGSFGYHELYVNGTRVGDSVLDPAVSRLTRRIYYRTYDIAPHLRPGKNTIAVWLGQGWAAWTNWSTYGTALDSPIKHGPAFIAVVRDNTGANLATTDATWKTAPANLAAHNQWMWAAFGGEKLDATAAVPDWNTTTFDDAPWHPATILTATEPVRLTAHLVQPNRVIRQFAPVAIAPIPGLKDAWRVDFGQNYTGWVRLPLVGPAGTQVTLRYSERYNPKKPTKDLTNFSQVDHITLSGDPARDIFENRFNYHQFRWLTIEGLPAQPDITTFTAKQIRTAYAPASTFASSDPDLDKIHALARHTYESLTLGGYIVDCSHRERGGYGAEGQASMETGMYNYDQAALLRKWAGDWGDMLHPNGDLPHCAPTYWGGGGPAWKMASINIPWAAYTHYGDPRVLAENYPTMRAHLAFVQKQIDGNPDKVFPGYGGSVWNNIGDWYAANRVDPPRNQRLNEPLIKTRQFFANCFTLHTLDNIARAAAALGNTEDAAHYTARATALRAAVHKKFYDPAIGYARKDQTYLAFALLANIPPPHIRPLIEAALEKDIRETQEGHITSGVLGTYMQLKHLTQTGRSDLAHLLITQPGVPGWKHFLERGDTTLPEVWNPEKAPAYGQSLAHSSFISVGSWFIEGLAGIRVDPANPGFSHFFVSPGATDQVEWVRATHDTARGPIAVQWKHDKAPAAAAAADKISGAFHLDVTVPPNATATIRIPAKTPAAVTESGKPLAQIPGAKVLPALPGAALIRVGSGTYHFTADFTSK